MYVTYLLFALQYRKTIVGPVWVLLGPLLFIVVLGLLFSEVSGIDRAVFVPHLAVGFIVWTLISGFVTGSTDVFQRSRAQIMQGGMTLIDIAIVDVLRTLLQFLHQLLILVGVFIVFDLPLTLYSLVSVFGLALLILNGLWLTMFFGILGVRYRDLTEVVGAVMRIAFLATPIIWMPFAEEGRAGVLTAFLTFNPFYHFLETIRAPLLGIDVDPLSWMIVGGFTVFGSLVAYLFYRRLHLRVPLWV